MGKIALSCIKEEDITKLTPMIVVTATLVFLLLVFAPIRLKMSVSLVYEQLSAHILVRLGVLRVFDESVRLEGGSLCCDGTIDAQVRLQSIDRQGGVELLRCVTFEKVYVSAYSDMARSVYGPLAVNVIFAAATAVACSLCRCQVCTDCNGTTGKSRLEIRALISLSVAELSFCLLRQGVRKWKTRRSER